MVRVGLGVGLKLWLRLGVGRRPYSRAVGPMGRPPSRPFGTVSPEMDIDVYMH